MAKLYEIKAQLAALIDDETGEITDMEAFAALDMQRDEKIENMICMAKNLKADIAAFKAEESSLAGRRKAAENKLEGLETYIAAELAGNKFQTPKCSATFRRSTYVDVDPDFVEWASKNNADEYLRYKAPEADKEKIGDAIKAGVEFEHARFAERISMTLK